MRAIDEAGSPPDESGMERLLVHLKTEQAWSVHGQVIDGAPEMAVAEFPRRESPTVPVGQKVDLVFWGARLNEPYPVQARVVACDQHGDSYRYRFRFEPGVAEVLLGVLERRRTTRIQPEVSTPIRVLVQGSKQPVEGVLKDISEEGLGVLICREDEGRLFDSWTLTLCLTLPEDEEPLILIGDVRYRRLAGSQLHYGVELDPGKSEDFAVQRQRIAAYIERRRSQVSKDEAAGRR